MVLAAEELRGVIVSVLPNQHEVVVRQDAAGGMPATTMVYRVDAKENLDHLRVGDHVAGRTDVSVDPPRLDDLRALGSGRSGTTPRSLLDMPSPVAGVSGPLGSWGLLVLMMVILAGMSWLLYRWGRVIFSRDEPGKR